MHTVLLLQQSVALQTNETTLEQPVPLVVRPMSLTDTFGQHASKALGGVVGTGLLHGIVKLEQLIVGRLVFTNVTVWLQILL